MQLSQNIFVEGVCNPDFHAVYLISKSTMNALLAFIGVGNPSNNSETRQLNGSDVYILYKLTIFVGNSKICQSLAIGGEQWKNSRL